MRRIDAITNLDYSRFVEKFDKKILVRKNFGLKKIWFEKKSGSKKYLVQSRFESFFGYVQLVYEGCKTLTPLEFVSWSPLTYFWLISGAVIIAYFYHKRKNEKNPISITLYFSHI